MIEERKELVLGGEKISYNGKVNKASFFTEN
jgi:hypothetical protein